MKRKVTSLILVLIIVFLCAALVACNKTERAEFELPEGAYPSTLTNLISSENLDVINAALDVNASETAVKDAVMLLYTIANGSRDIAATSLMVQKTDMTPAMDLGYVAMRGFTLKEGDRWFYQFAAQGVSEDETAALFLNAFGSQQLQIGYTKGDGKYYYFKEMSEKPECDCSLTMFPYANFKVTRSLDLYETEDDFQAARYYLNSQLEINNMNLCKEIIKDGAKITYDASAHLYKVEFEVDCVNGNQDLLKEWYACANKDMMDSGNKILGYNYWTATMEVWDNGYVKSFVSDEDRRAGSGSGPFGEIAGGQTTNAYEYLYGVNEIRELLAEDARFNQGTRGTFSIEEFLDGYEAIANNKQPASMGKLTKIIIIVVVVVVVVIVGIIVLIEVLVKKGKLPKLAAKRQKRKEKRMAKKGQVDNTLKSTEEDENKED